MKTKLKKCLTKQEFCFVHDIRQKVLFPDMDYNRNHPDDSNPNHHQFLFYADEKPIATFRLDFIREKEVALRLVAVVSEYQGRGVGSIMLSDVEKYCKSMNIEKISTNAEPDAVKFYKKNGFAIENWDDPGEGVSRKTTSMVKRI